ncbi:MAG: hypothetical protein EKK55_01050 [Rhodocyclaceae bacterium]|nr:MAG: hypothetical protein EKK55_01050 [Rhodocyclaceae bacterium]
MFDLSLPVPTAIGKWLKTYAPEKDQRLWMRGGVAPIGPFDVFDVLEDSGVTVPFDTLYRYLQRLISDSIERVGYAEVGTPEFAGLRSLMPTFEFADTDPEDKGTWNLAPQEISIRHLAWAYTKHGVYQAGVCAAIQFLAYFRAGWHDPEKDPRDPSGWFSPEHEMRPAKWSYLRNGGDPAKRFSNRGRNRILRGCLQMFNSMIRICAQSAQWAMVDQLRQWRDRLILLAWESWPLVDDGAGDHLGADVPFFSVYQTASLWTELWETSHIDSEIDPAIVSILSTMRRDCMAIIDGAEEERDGQFGFTYDVRFDGMIEGTKSPKVSRVPGSTWNRGADGVNQYLYRALNMNGRPAAETLLADARKRIDHNRYPWVLPQYFGTL